MTVAPLPLPSAITNVRVVLADDGRYYVVLDVLDPNRPTPPRPFSVAASSFTTPLDAGIFATHLRDTFANWSGKPAAADVQPCQTPACGHGRTSHAGGIGRCRECATAGTLDPCRRYTA